MLRLKKDVKKEIPDLSTMTLLATVERYINRIPAARDWRLTEWITREVGKRDRLRMEELLITITITLPPTFGQTLLPGRIGRYLMDWGQLMIHDSRFRYTKQITEQMR
jgi:hypothetical protein